MNKTLRSVGITLALVGGILLILFGLLDVFGATFRIISELSLLRGTVYSLAEIGIGVVCVVGSKYVSKLGWGLLLLVLGIIAGSLGGTLVALGAILGLISSFAKLK